MSSYNMYSMTKEDLTDTLNTGKEIFVRTMRDEGIITDQQYEQMQEHAIVIARKGFFGSLWDKIFKKDDGGYYFVVKILTPKNSNISKQINDEEE